MIFESKRDNQRFFKRGENFCKPHFHSSTEVLYVLSGEKLAIVNEKEYLLTQGQVLVCPAFFVHAFPRNEVENQSIVVTIRPEDCQEFYHACQEQTPISLVFSDDNKTVLNYLSVLEKAKNNLSITGAIYGILGEFVDKVTFEKNTKKQDKSFITNVALYINDNYSKQISLGQIAGLFGYSRTYFSVLFRKNFGVSFTDYVNSVRVKKSLKILNEYNSSTVYLHVGFNSPQQYYLNFKKFYGKSPKEYMRLNDR